jgi:hypothetical protein
MRWNRGEGDVDSEGGTVARGGGFETKGDVGRATEWILGEEVGGFDEDVELGVCGASDGGCGGEDGVEGIADGVV